MTRSQYVTQAIAGAASLLTGTSSDSAVQPILRRVTDMLNNAWGVELKLNCKLSDQKLFWDMIGAELRNTQRVAHFEAIVDETIGKMDGIVTISFATVDSYTPYVIQLTPKNLVSTSISAIKGADGAFDMSVGEMKFK